jgi:hypothetical protein
MQKKYKIGQYTGVKMADGSYKVCRILQIYEPGKPGPFCKMETYTEVYTNENDHPTFWLDGGWITVPDIFFKSKRDADLWILKKKLESVSKELLREQKAHKRTLVRLHHIRKAISKL